MCGSTQTTASRTASASVKASARRTFAVGDTARTPGGSTGTIIAQDGGMSWIKTASGKNFFRNTADLLDRSLIAGDAVITQKGNKATVRAVVDGTAWVQTRGNRQVARSVDSLTRA